MAVDSDKGETPDQMEPMLIAEGSRHRGELMELVFDLAQKSARLEEKIPASLRGSIVKLVRSMNCYYSNLIEGHHTHPIDIECALKNDYSQDPEKRNLQLEAKAHIAVQAWIDEQDFKGYETSRDGIIEIHKRFCQDLPEELLRVKLKKGDEYVDLVPGQVRDRYVEIGRLVPVSPGATERFLNRFEEVYSHLKKHEKVLSCACAHHRFLWIHPFLDGNGRVARLMSYAMLKDALSASGIWSISRGLARNEGKYKSLLMQCDLRRRNDLDGRGHLSEEALAEFVKFFLSVCLDQVEFMERLLEPDRLRARIKKWARAEIAQNNLPIHSDRILEAILYRGELPRGDIADILHMTDRQGRRITSALEKAGILDSVSPRAPFTLAFPAALSSAWFPALFPERQEEQSDRPILTGNN